MLLQSSQSRGVTMVARVKKFSAWVLSYVRSVRAPLTDNERDFFNEW
jgi:hypothetical protein